MRALDGALKGLAASMAILVIVGLCFVLGIAIGYLTGGGPLIMALTFFAVALAMIGGVSSTFDALVDLFERRWVG